MSKTPPILANLPPEVQAYVAAQEAELSGLKQEFLGVSLDHATVQKRLKDEMEAALAAERAAQARAIQNKDTMIADLRLQLHGARKHRFGSKSESSAQLALELILEELEIEKAAEAPDEEVSSDAETAKPPHSKGLCRPRTSGPHPVLQIRLSPASVSPKPDVCQRGY